MKKKKWKVLVSSIAMMLFLCLSCSEKVMAETSVNKYEQTIIVTKPAKMKKQDILKQNYCTLHCGEQMKLTVGGKNATNWKSSNTKVVSVNSSGVLTACNLKDAKEYSGGIIKSVTISCKKNGKTYRCFVTNGKLSLEPSRFYYKGDGSKISESIDGLCEKKGPSGYKLYKKQGKSTVESKKVTEQLRTELKCSSSDKSVVTITRTAPFKYRLEKKKSGTSVIKAAFTTNAGYRYIIKKTVCFSKHTRDEAYNEMLDNAEEYFDRWKVENMVHYTEEEVAEKLKKVVKDFPDGEYYKDSKYYDTEWKTFGPFGEVMSYTAEGFSYAFASRINCAVFGMKECGIGVKDTGEYVYITQERPYIDIIGGGVDDGVAWHRPIYYCGYANGCSGFSKEMSHFTNDFDRIRVGDIVVTKIGSSDSRAGVVLSKSEDAVHVIYSNKTTHYKDWTKKWLNRYTFIVVTRYE